MRLSAVMLKRGLLFAWAGWLTCILVPNLFSGLKAMGLVGPAWAYASHNYALVAKTVGDRPWLAVLLYVGLLAWQAWAASALWQAFLAYRGRQQLSMACHALGLCLLLFGAFLMAGELFLDYSQEAVHLRVFTAQAATLLLIALLPDE